MEERNKILFVETRSGRKLAARVRRFWQSGGSRKYHPTESSWRRIEKLINKHSPYVEINDGEVIVCISFVREAV